MQTGGSYWSCDTGFEQVATKIGFCIDANRGIDNRNPHRCYRMMYPDSTYSRGDANNAVPWFHVLRERKGLPRLHCFHCENAETIGWPANAGHGNYEEKYGGSDGSWFVNHKGAMLFYDYHSEMKHCKRYMGFPPPCQEAQMKMATERGEMVSTMLSEGLAYDSEGKTFCRKYSTDSRGGSGGGAAAHTSIFEDQTVWQALQAKAKKIWEHEIFWCPARLWGGDYESTIMTSYKRRREMNRASDRNRENWHNQYVGQYKDGGMPEPQ
jgi:hypothetical protein